MLHTVVVNALGSGFLHYSREAFGLALILVSMCYCIVQARKQGRSYKLLVITSLLVVVATTIELFIVGDGQLTFVERLKGWFGFNIGCWLGLALGPSIKSLKSRKISWLIVLMVIGISCGVIGDHFFQWRISDAVETPEFGVYAMGYYRAAFIFDSAMGAGYTLAACGALTVAIMNGATEWRLRMACSLAVLLCAVAILLSLSRGAAVVASIVYILVSLCMRRRIVAIVALSMLAGTAGLTLFSVASSRNWIASLANFSTETSNKARLESWRAGLDQLASGPVLGYGLGSARSYDTRLVTGLTTNTENTILYAQFEGGYPLSITVSLLLLSAALVSLKRYLQALRVHSIELGVTSALSLATIIYSFVFPLVVERTIGSYWFLGCAACAVVGSLPKGRMTRQAAKSNLSK